MKQKAFFLVDYTLAWKQTGNANGLVVNPVQAILISGN